MVRFCRAITILSVLFVVLPLAAQPGPGGSPTPLLTPEDRQFITRLQQEISWTEMQKILEPFNSLDRISGGAGEARASALLVAALQQYGIPYQVHRFRAYLSWPLRAELRVVAPEQKPLRAVTVAFSAATAPQGLEGELVFVGSPGPIFGALTPRAYTGPEVRGKIVVADGLITPQHARLVEELGAAGLVHINPRELLHEMIITTVWGTPTLATMAHIPRIPALSITRADGEWLKQLSKRGPVRVRLVTEVSTAWRTIPLVVAEVKGALEPESFTLVSSHLDAWYKGMTDTGSTDASMLEMARILHRHRSRLRRGFRFAWWPGHSTGRYAGSTWYADEFWSELDRHCVAYMNLDGPGTRSVPLDQIAAWAWPELADFTKQFARELTGQEPQEGYFAGALRVFRPFRAGDSSFQGIGIPEVSIGLPEIPRGHPDRADYVGGSERGWWWHTPEDTLDKIDPKALVRDTELRLGELYVLATLPVLPYRISAIAHSYRVALADLQAAVGTHLELTALSERAERLEAKARELEALAERLGRGGAGAPARQPRIAELNRLLLKLSHELNATLYTATGRFRQDPAAHLPILPGLDRARALAQLDPTSDRYGFLRTQMVRERNRVAHTLDAALDDINAFLTRSAKP
ncbi:MAG: M28 family peptidase [Terriglobia bacterium]